MQDNSSTETPVISPDTRERRNSYDSFPVRNNNASLEEIELGTVVSRSQHEDRERFGSSFDLLEVRRSFIKKVYGIVGLEILLVIFIVAIFMFTPLREEVYNSSTWLIICSILIPLVFGFLFILAFFPVEKYLREWPLNISLLTLIAMTEGVILGILSAYFKQESIMIAGGLTAITVFMVSIFALFTNIDFTKRKSILYVLFILFVLFSFAFLIVYMLADDYTVYVMRMVFGVLGAMVMVFCLIYDTQLMILGKHKHCYNPEEYIFAALSIFLDIMNLFIYIFLWVGGRVRGY